MQVNGLSSQFTPLQPSMAMKNAPGRGGEIEVIAETIQETVWPREIIKKQESAILIH